ncbi:hypothetical protein GCM10010517_36470 [Streptosporangium fragile]|uniref:Uncharacterized protein n=2 Tax=Streptosporangium fragile TaxID=46186 RepID=A0ABN3VYX9_9ACTN
MCAGSPRAAVCETFLRLAPGVECRPPTCFAGVMMTLQRRPARFSWRALVTLVVVTLLLGVALGMGVWWLLAMGWESVWGPPRLPVTRS